ncbi:MAG: OmpA family protein, partial [Gammaproteobacteria bacterium]
GCPVDVDQDGVSDNVDQCPGTPKGVAVDARGCARDDDGDSVPNYKDQCPATPAGAEVDDKGCRKLLKETVRISLDIKFPSNSSMIDPKYTIQIKKVADFMRRFPDTKVVIEGHTDSTGSASYNKWLSQRRADAVAQWLVNKFGIDAKRVSAIGYGEERPIADNNTAEGRAKNRRVVAAISATVTKQ